MERRKIERFDLVVPCLLDIDEFFLRDGLMELKTRNLSASGVFLSGNFSIDLATPVTVDIIIPPHIISSDSKGGCFISTAGCVVRRENDGVAVCFKKEYHVAPLARKLQLIKLKTQWIDKYSKPKVNTFDNVFDLEQRMLMRR